MEVGKLTVERRASLGKGAAHKLRAQGLVPGVCYGATASGPLASFPITVNVKALKASLDPIRKQNTVIDLTVMDGGQAQTLSVLVKDYQLHATRREITHVDILAIDPTKEVAADVPVEYTGKAKGLIDGGQLRILVRSIHVKAKPADIPVKFTVDVSALDIGDVLHVSDVAMPAGVTATSALEQAIVTCAQPTADKDPAPADAAAAPAADPKAAAAAAPAKGAAAAPAAAAAAKAPAKK